MSDPRYALYYAPGAASLVVHWLLVELGQPVTLHKVELGRDNRSPEYLKLNPNGVVPTLLIDGRPVSETVALLIHLADTHPEAGLAPGLCDPDRASYLQWLVHLTNTVQTAFLRWFLPARIAGEANVEAVKAHAREAIEGHFTRIDAQLAEHGPNLLGTRLSAADFMLTMLLRWSRNMPKPATEWPHLATMAQRMRARPSYAVVYRAEGLNEWPPT